MKYASLGELFNEKVEQLGSKEAFRYKKGDHWVSVTWTEMGRRVRSLALSLLDMGLKKGDKICILANTRYEWEIADRAILSIGGVTVGIYQTLPAAQVKYQVVHSEAKAIFAENAVQLAKVLEFADQCPELKHIAVFDPTDCEGREFMTLDDLTAPSRDKQDRHGKALDEMAASVGHDDIATLIYTSGTTGPPKGAIISQFNLLCEAEALVETVGFLPDDFSLTWLPLSHIYQRAATVAGLWAGAPTAYAESVEKLLANLAEIKPTIFYSVPRIYEKAFSKILDGAEKAGFPKKQIFFWSMKVGRKVSQLRQQKKAIPPLLAMKFSIAQKLVFGKIKALFGGRVRFIGSSGAPIAKEILEFFHAADLVPLEGYGATETTAAITLNRTEAYKFGTVGQTSPHIEIKIAEDGEILAKGDLIFKGYYKEPDKTAEVISEDGWYATGDIGEIDEDGFLKITDRKKDIIVTSGGKNVAPQNIENMLKQSIYISQAMVHGDKRKYLTCLITLDPDTVEHWAEENGLDPANWDAVCSDAKAETLIEDAIKTVNADLAKFETIKYFKIVTEDFTVENELLTPTLKLKRKVVTEKYRDLLDSMYAG
jgi:long-chain acyl-CoA synthetase